MARRLSDDDRLDLYRSEIEMAVRWRDDAGYDRLWSDLNNMYRNKTLPDGLSDEDRIAVNIAFSTINVIYPSVSVRYPKLAVLPTRPEFDAAAQTSESILNYYWKHHKFHKPFRSAVKDFLIFGHGWTKIGWRYLEEETVVDPDELAAQLDAATAQARMFAQQNPELSYLLPSDDDIAATMESARIAVLEDRPFVERVSPFAMYVNPEATDLDDARWLAQRIIRPLDEVKNDERFSRTARARLKPDRALGKHLSEADARKYGEHIQRVTLWEFYDLQDGKMCVWAEGADKYMTKPIDMPYHCGHPYEMIRNYDVPDDFYPIGELEMIEPLSDELNKTRSQLMNHRKRYARKYLVRESLLSDRAKQAIVSQNDGELVPIDDTTVQLNDVVIPIQQVPLDASVYSYSDIIMSDIREVTGISEYARGAMPEVRRTATEAAMIQDAINARSADKLAIVEMFVSDIARKVLQVTQQFLTGENVVPLAGQEGAAGWRSFTRSEIKGEFDFSVEAGSTQPMNDSFRRLEAERLMQAMAPFLTSGVVNPAELAAHVLRQGFGIKDPERFITAVPLMPLGGPPQQPGQPGQPQQPPAVPAQIPDGGPDGQQLADLSTAFS